tara:strand:- start:898 stop:1611 length:714 start_codon:yes stop_codon:yes gene_type:complete
MKILIQFPTLARPEKFLRVLEKYVDMCGNGNELFFNINCDAADQSMLTTEVKDRMANILNRKDNVSSAINYDENTDKISAINDHVGDYGDFDIVVCASDDMLPQVEKWDEEISNAMQEHFPDLDGCVHFNDGNTNGELITFSILGRELYNHFGYIYHPDYKSLYCDAEFTEEVKRMGKEKYIDNVIISHEHYSVEGTENQGQLDYAAKKTLHFSGRDELVFNERKKMGFPKQKITMD